MCACSFARRAARTALLALLCAPPAGCVLVPDQESSAPMLSPDGRVLLYLQSDKMVARGMPVVVPLDQTVSQDAALRWQPAGGGPEHVVPIAWKSGGGLMRELRTVFSPDGRHVAVVTPDGVTVADLDSAEHWRLTPGDEQVTSLAWLSAGEVAYAAHTNRRGTDDAVSDRTFWRQRIAEPASARTRIYQEAGVRAGLDEEDGVWPLEAWSPGGRYVVFHDRGKAMALLDAATGTTRTFGRAGVYIPRRVSWKPDGSAAACLSVALDRSHTEALLLDPLGDEPRDFSWEYTQALHGRVGNERPAWTADGEYLLINDRGRGAYMIRPHPWKVIAVHQRLGDAGHADFQEGRDWVTTSLAPLAVRGWVVVRAPSGKDFAVDYECQQLVPLSEGRMLTYASPDGSSVVLLEYGVQAVRRVSLPPPPPPPPASEEPAGPSAPSPAAAPAPQPQPQPADPFI